MSKNEEKGEIVLYQPEGDVRLEVHVKNETVWLTQAQMAELFGKVPQNITIHIKNIYKEGELDKGSTCKEYLQVAHEGSRNVTRLLKFYNLDVIISVGYRVIQKRTDTYVSARLSTQSSRRPEHLRKRGKNYATLRSFSPQGGSCSHKR